MTGIVVITTSYPRHPGDAEGHFVSAEVRRLCRQGRVTVLAPGRDRPSLWGERVVGLPGGDAFGFPGALEKLKQRQWHLLGAGRFVVSASSWLRHAPALDRVVAHFLLPCGVPIATRGLRGRATELEVVVHGSDARLFAGLPAVRGLLGRELIRAGARLRFVSNELRELVLQSLPAEQRVELASASRIEASPLDVQEVPSRAEARQQLQLEPSAKLAVIVARLVPGKRVDVALEACRRIGNLTCYVIGDGPERARLSALFPHAHFVGHVERPVALSYIAAADVLVSASLQEGAPSAIREARALGTPVVCLDAGDLRAWAAEDPGLLIAGQKSHSATV
jgi:teichuronic acid biosynthesis glycosyltransferase TuaC